MSEGNVNIFSLTVPNRRVKEGEGGNVASSPFVNQDSEGGQGYLGALSLTQRHLLKLFGEAQLISQLEQVGHGVGTRGQNKHERGGAAGVQEGPCQVEGGWLCEGGPQVLCHKALNG